jgi:hypothetical protein
LSDYEAVVLIGGRARSAGWSWWAILSWSGDWGCWAGECEAQGEDQVFDLHFCEGWGGGLWEEVVL